jgi:hypothetical protein
VQVKRMAAAVGVGALALLAALTLSNGAPADIQANNNFGGAGQTVMPAAGSGTNVTATSSVVSGPAVKATFFGKG